MTDVKGLKERLEAKARASFEANKSFGRKGKEWAIETEVEWQALAYIADLEAKLAEAREALKGIHQAVSPGTLQVDDLDIGEVADTALNTIGEDHG